jgi:hypothetical protein
LVLISAGGTLIELMRDRVAVLPPVDRFQAMRAVRRLSIGSLLLGHRGSALSNVDALVNVVTRFSELALDLSGVFTSIDLNPVIVGPASVVVVDALVTYG